MRGYVALLLLLAAIWGASFMFIKIAVDELAPTTTMFLRLAFSALPLLALVVYKLGVRQAWDQLRAITKAAVVLGIVNTALPFTLIAWGETRIDSGVAAIANASLPIFVVILAFFFRKSESATGIEALRSPARARGRCSPHGRASQGRPGRRRRNARRDRRVLRVRGRDALHPEHPRRGAERRPRRRVDHVGRRLACAARESRRRRRTRRAGA